MTIHKAVLNPLTRQPIIQQQGNGGNPAGTQAALNAPAVRNPQSRPFSNQNSQSPVKK